MIRLRKLTRTFPGSGRVLDAVDLDVQAGDFVTIMGPSGAGKSTLLAVLAMLDHDWQGDFHFFDEPVHRMNGQASAPRSGASTSASSSSASTCSRI